MSSFPAQRATFGDVFAVREFRILWLSQSLSEVGDRLALVALTLLVYNRTGSPLLSAVAYAAGYVPWVVGGLIFSGLGDRLPRREVMVACDVIRALLVAVMLLPGMPVAGLVGLLYVTTMAQAPFESARSAILPDILSGERYALAATVMQTSFRVAIVAGAAVGGVTVALIGTRPALGVDAATFLASAVLVRFGTRARPAAGPGPGALKQLGEGARLVLGDKAIRTLMMIGWLIALYSIPEGIAAPYAGRLGGGPAAAGLVIASGQAGAVLAAPLFTRKVGPLTRLRWMGPMAVCTCAVLPLTIFRPGLAVSMAIFALSGTFAIYQIAANTAFVEWVPDTRRAQAFGLANIGTVVGQGAALTLAGAAAQVVSPSTVIALGGGLGALVACALALRWRHIPDAGAASRPAYAGSGTRIATVLIDIPPDSPVPAPRVPEPSSTDHESSPRPVRLSPDDRPGDVIRAVPPRLWGGLRRWPGYGRLGSMKVSMFEQVPYRYLPEGFESQHNSVVTAPYQFVDPRRMQESLLSAYAELMHAARVGFDGVCVTEHSQSSYDISPNPTLLASAVACATQAEHLDVAIAVLGRSLGKTREPLKIAEEYALLDCVSGGRLIAGFPVGLSYDANLNAALPAVETRERYREHRELILKAWSEQRPFPWNGRFEKYGQVNIWPRPIQQPHPPVWIPGTGSPGTLSDILRRDYAFVYLSWDGPKLTGRQVFDRYWELAEELGRDRNPYRLAFLQVVAVSETDERAEKEYAKHLQAHYRSGLGAIPHTAMAVPGYAEPAAIEGMLRSTGPAGMLSRMKTATFSEIVDSQVAIVGSPATVADQIEEFVREFRIGNLLVMLQNGSMPRDLTEKNISLFAAEVLPHLRPIWDDEGWANHWWPRAQGTAAGEKA